MVRGATVEETVFEKPAKDDDGLAYLADSVKKKPDEKSTPRVETERELLKDSTKDPPAESAPPVAAAAPKKTEQIPYMKLYQYSSPRDKC